MFALAGLGTLWCRRHGRTLPHGAERVAMLVAAGVVVAWVVRIGGDAQHYRYLAFPVCLAVTSLGGVAEAVLRDVAWSRRLAVAALAGVTLLAYPRQLDRHPLRAGVVPTRVDGISDATHHRVHPELVRLDPWGSGAPIELLPRYRAWIAGGADPRPTTGPVVPDYICWRNYLHFERRSVHSLGLADAVLAHTAMPLTLPGHKFGLVFMAGDLARLEDWWGRPPDRGMFRAAVAAGVAPAWVVANVDVLEAIAARAFNRHDLAENLRLALTPIPPVVPSPALRDLAEQSRGTVK